MRLLYFLTVFLFVSPLAFAQKQTLQQILEKETAGFRGDVGIYVQHLKTGEEAAINADTIFPTASIVKVPILVGVMDKIEKGELAYHQKMIYRDSIKYGGSGLMQNFKDSTETELSILMSLMITYSDNTSSLWCQALAGGGERINEIMNSLGLRYTRVNSRTPGREEDWKKYGWGQTTPREMAQLLVKIRKGEAISSAASDRMYRLMGNIYYDEYALSAIPAQVQTASKQGMVNASRSELVMVNAPKGDYVFYFATKNNEDQRWEDDNEAQVLQQRISKVLWEWFEK
jgi:beta-lactamase class A